MAWNNYMQCFGCSYGNFARLNILVTNLPRNAAPKVDPMRLIL